MFGLFYQYFELVTEIHLINSVLLTISSFHQYFLLQKLHSSFCDFVTPFHKLLILKLVNKNSQIPIFLFDLSKQLGIQRIFLRLELQYRSSDSIKYSSSPTNLPSHLWFVLADQIFVLPFFKYLLILFQLEFVMIQHLAVFDLKIVRYSFQGLDVLEVLQQVERSF